ncbi:MAG: hypothetical protein KDI37_07630, partial [Xanthomonadales bacterium]|nr:hypothetical protein [Xanthomonadales bacterium]
RAEAEDLASFMIGELYTELKKVGKLPLLEPVAFKAVDYYGDLRTDQISAGRGEQALALIRVAEVLDMQGHWRNPRAPMRVPSKACSRWRGPIRRIR